MRCLFMAGICIIVGAARIAGQELPAPREPAAPLAGTVLLHGGGPVADKVVDHFVKLAGGDKARLLILVSQGSKSPTLGTWKEKRVAEIFYVEAGTKGGAGVLNIATGVWLGDGELDVAVASAMKKELHGVLERGGVIAGVSASAAAVGRWYLPKEAKAGKAAMGLGLVTPLVVEPLFSPRREGLVDALTKNPGHVGLGLSDGTVVEIKGRTLTVLSQAAATCLAAGKDRPASVQEIKTGGKADLMALSRAALARAGEPFPPVKLPDPVVPKGTLIIGGGGGLPDEVWKRFLDQAGGTEAAIVVIPTALEPPIPLEPGEAKKLKKLGAKHVKVLHAKSKAEAETPEFLEALRQAKGLWFTGGRQWRLVDVYQDTKAHEEMHGILERGGVIGGSSAGASIQADYMARGDPLGNLNIIAEGYERGLSFLPGVAIDQHFFKRKRTADMTELMGRYPQLLGIGIDEGTALVVRGEIMEIVGVSKVAVYDRRRHLIAGMKDYQELNPGDRFNLKKRAQAK